MPSYKTHVHDIVTKYLAGNEDACMLVVKDGAATILDSFAAENHTFCNLCTLAAFGQSVPRGHAVFLHWQYRVIVETLKVLGWHFHMHSVFVKGGSEDCRVILKSIVRLYPDYSVQTSKSA